LSFSENNHATAAYFLGKTGQYTFGLIDQLPKRVFFDLRSALTCLLLHLSQYKRLASRSPVHRQTLCWAKIS